MSEGLPRRSDLWRLAALLASLPLLRALLAAAAQLDLNIEEAQYWAWSQHPDWSYYSKGPLVAWLIALATGLFGHGEWQVRLFAWLFYDVFLILLFCFAYQVWQDRRAAWWAVILGLTTPLFFTLGQVMTTDVLLFVCWTWALWAVYRALYRHRPAAWYEAGIAVGLGGLTKLSIMLLPFFVGLVLLCTRAGRAELRRFPPWGGLLLGVVVMSPMLYWNATHDWVMFRHEQRHVGGLNPSPRNTLEFLLSQWVVLSPVVAVLAAHRLSAAPADPGRRLLWLVSLGVLGFFVLKALLDRVQVNWAAPAYIGFMVLFAGHVADFSGARRKALYGGIAFSVLALAIALFPHALGIRGVPFRDLKGWSDGVAELARQAPQAQFILTPSYHKASELAFYWPERVPVYLTSDGWRGYNQYDLWPGVDREAGRDGLVVTDWPRLPPLVKRAFAACEPLPPVSPRAPNGVVLRTHYAWFCRDLRPIEWLPPQGY